MGIDKRLVARKIGVWKHFIAEGMIYASSWKPFIVDMLFSASHTIYIHNLIAGLKGNCSPPENMYFLISFK